MCRVQKLADKDLGAWNCYGYLLSRCLSRNVTFTRFGVKKFFGPKFSLIESMKNSPNLVVFPKSLLWAKTSPAGLLGQYNIKSRQFLVVWVEDKRQEFSNIFWKSPEHQVDAKSSTLKPQKSLCKGFN